MRILITLAAAAAIMAGLVIGIAMAASILTRSAEGVAARTRTLDAGGALPKVAYAVLWALVAGAAAGLIGSN